MTYFALPAFTPPLQQVHRTLLQIAPDAVLVGGVIRDLLLNKPVRDLDYALPAQARHSARRLANTLGGAYYPLDEKRDIGRVVWQPPVGPSLVIDIAAWQAPSLKLDLVARDFTINAMALLAKDELYDPLGGYSDLQHGWLRPCSPHSLQNDPLRSLRAVRFLLQIELQPTPELADLVKAAAPLLPTISPERRRDEWLKILQQSSPERAFMWLEKWELLPLILPELVLLQGLTQPAIHAYDAYEHTLTTLGWLARLDEALRGDQRPEDPYSAEIYAALAPYRTTLATYLQHELSPGHPRWLWLRFAALAHDWGKAQTSQINSQDDIHFYGHESISAELAARWLRDYHCANAERKFVATVCRLHMRPVMLLAQEKPPSRRARFRFLRDAGDEAFAIMLLHIADYCATLGPALTPASLRRHLTLTLDLVQPRLESQPHAVIPSPLLSGRDLIQHFGLKPGPLIGELLAGLQEAQALGEVATLDQAIIWVQSRLQQRNL